MHTVASASDTNVYRKYIKVAPVTHIAVQLVRFNNNPELTTVLLNAFHVFNRHRYNEARKSLQALPWLKKRAARRALEQRIGDTSGPSQLSNEQVLQPLVYVVQFAVPEAALLGRPAELGTLLGFSRRFAQALAYYDIYEPLISVTELEYLRKLVRRILDSGKADDIRMSLLRYSAGTYSAEYVRARIDAGNISVEDLNVAYAPAIAIIEKAEKAKKTTPASQDYEWVLEKLQKFTDVMKTHADPWPPAAKDEILPGERHFISITESKWEEARLLRTAEFFSLLPPSSSSSGSSSSSSSVSGEH